MMNKFQCPRCNEIMEVMSVCDERELLNKIDDLQAEISGFKARARFVGLSEETILELRDKIKAQAAEIKVIKFELEPDDWLVNKLRDKVDSRDDKIERLKEPLKISECPNCDGSGYTAVRVSDDKWKQVRCQWCDEREKERTMSDEIPREKLCELLTKNENRIDQLQAELERQTEQREYFECESESKFKELQKKASEIERLKEKVNRMRDDIVKGLSEFEKTWTKEQTIKER